MNRVVMVLILIGCLTCYGQSSYKGLTPGKSTKIQVERVLGPPVKKVSETLFEYRPQPLAGRIFVQYREDTRVVERLEFICRLPDSDCNDFLKSLNLSLPDAEEISRTDKDKSIIYTAPPYCIAETVDEEGQFRIAFYSRELYDATVADVKAENEAAAAKAEEELKKPERQEIASATGAVIDSVKQESHVAVGSEERSAAPNLSLSGRWSGSWRNSKGESGNTSINFNEQEGGAITGDEDGWVMVNGRRSGNVVTWEYGSPNQGCRHYLVRWEISPDGRTANGIYTMTDRCERQSYTGAYFNYHR